MTYEAREKKIETTMQPYLDLFESDLTEAQLAPKTIRSHVENMQLFLVDYSIRYLDGPEDENEEIQLYDVLSNVGDFVGYFFIYKCLWSTPSSVKALCASIKKFCGCMLDHKKLTREEYDNLLSDWRERVQSWADDCRTYNDDGTVPWF